MARERSEQGRTSFSSRLCGPSNSQSELVLYWTIQYFPANKLAFNLVKYSKRVAVRRNRLLMSKFVPDLTANINRLVVGPRNRCFRRDHEGLQRIDIICDLR